MGQEQYKRLGDYIQAVDERNIDGLINNAQGISNNKYFQKPKQVATNSRHDNIVRHGYFAYNRATTRNGEKISISYREGDDCTVSGAYQVFKIVDEELLNPYYLWMWFRRPEFDRYARYRSHGSAHEFFEFEEMCNVMLPVPPIARQREIVEQYATLTRRIHLNEQTIDRLEATAQALYRKMFVTGIDPNQLPEGWRMGTLSDVATISSGKTCKEKNNERTHEYPYPVAGASGIIGYASTFNNDERLLTTGRVGTLGVVNRYEGKIFTADNVLVAKSNYYEYAYQLLQSVDYEEITKGGVQSLITQTDLNNVSIIVPPNDELKDFEEKASAIFENVRLLTKESAALTTLQRLLLTRMTQS